MKFNKGIFALILILLNLSFLFWPSDTIADDVEQQFKTGIQSYNSGDYPGAVEIFSGLLEKGYRHYEVYYNLGCAYFKTGALGQSILNFNRALELNPSDEDSRINLEYARQFTIDKLETQKQGILLSATESVINLFDINSGLAITAIIIWVFLLLLSAIIWFKWYNRLAWSLFSILLTFVILSTAVSAYQIKRDSTSKMGVLIAEQSDVRSGPGEEFSLQFTAHQGLEFQVETSRDGYYMIKLGNGVKGWVDQNSVGIV